MAAEPLYRLANTTVVEPLVNGWAAWAHVVPPVPASLHLRNYQCELLRSYLENPGLHAQACENRKLRSGRFVNVPLGRAGEVEQLLRDTERRMAPSLELAQSLVEFHNRLAAEAAGQSLEPFYPQLPEPLRGYVELVYDYYNHPIVRFFERLTYLGPCYREDLQSLRLFRHTSDEARPFIMNTPRLPEAGQVDWRLPFADAALDELCRLDTAPQPLGRIRELLGLREEDDPALLALLTTEAPRPPRPRPEGDEVSVRYFGHACVLVEWGGVSVLTDPYVGAVPAEGGLARFTYEDLPERIDYVLVTHNHHDHFCLETLLRLRHRVGCLVVPRSSGVFYGDPSLKVLAEQVGFRNVVELDAFGSLPLPGGSVTAVPFLGEHADLPHSKTAYVLRAGAAQMMFGADSDCLDATVYEHVRRHLGAVETVFIGMECVGAPLSWSCGPFLPFRPDPAHDQSRRYKGCDSRRARQILSAVGAERVYVYAMGMEPWLEHLLGLAYTDDSPQLTESNLLVRGARAVAGARRLYGKAEFTLCAGGGATRASAPPPAAAAAAEDQFVFD